MSKECTKIKELFSAQDAHIGHEVTVRGWIRNHRKQKNMGFIELYDGSCFQSLQLVYTTEGDKDGRLKTLHNGSCIEAAGTVQQGFQKELIELDLSMLHCWETVPRTIPCSPKDILLNFCVNKPIFVREHVCSRPYSVSEAWLHNRSTPILRTEVSYM